MAAPASAGNRLDIRVTWRERERGLLGFTGITENLLRITEDLLGFYRELLKAYWDY